MHARSLHGYQEISGLTSRNTGLARIGKARSRPAPAAAPRHSVPEPARDDSGIEYLPATLATLVDVLDWHAQQHGERLLVTIESQLGAQPTQLTHLSYAKLRIDKASDVRARVQACARRAE